MRNIHSVAACVTSPLTVNPVLFLAHSIPQTPEMRNCETEICEIWTSTEVQFSIAIKMALIPRMPRVMLDTPSPISTTERTSKLQTSARLVHMLFRASFLRLGERVKCKDSLSHPSKKIDWILQQAPSHPIKVISMCFSTQEKVALNFHL